MKAGNHHRLAGQRGRARGTTLLEIVITMAIMSIGMLGFFSLHIRALSTSKSSLTMSQALALASALQDGLQGLPYTPTLIHPALQPCDPPTTDPIGDLCRPSPPVPVNKAGNQNTALGPLVFYPSYAVQIVPNAVNQNLIMITVRVRYPAEDGRCPACQSADLQTGWKAVTLTSMRAMTAY